MSLNSWLGHSSHCDSYHLQQKMLNKCDFLINSSINDVLYNNLIDDIQQFKYCDDDFFFYDLN